VKINQEHGIKLCAKVCIQQHGSGSISFPHTQKEVDFVEKSNKKCKAAADKKRRVKFFEEEDMMMYLKRRIPAERVHTEQLYPD